MQVTVHVRNLSKTYRIPVRQPGILGSLRSLTRPTYTNVAAVRDASFEVSPGEIVGFIGPNGSGKTTTLKVLSGLLYPTTGHIQVAGFVPWERKPEFLRRISLLMGNKSQLTWDNTVQDCFLIHKEIYAIATPLYRQRLDELVALLDMEQLLEKQARNLSLGERAKAQLVLALLHNPQVLFLDEPTLGLDVSMQLRFRRFVTDFGSRHQTTIVLTSHSMADIVSLCSRVLLIHHGSLIYDGELGQMAQRTIPFKLIRLAVNDDDKALDYAAMPRSIRETAIVWEQDSRSVTLRIPREQVAPIATQFIKDFPRADLSISDPPIEAVIDQVYQGGVL